MKYQKRRRVMSESGKCPKCGGKMAWGSDENLVRNFACTRGEPKPEDLRIVRVHSCYCKSCGYMEFYRESMAEERQTPSLTEDADKARKLHGKEKKEKPRVEEAERKESERKGALTRKEGQPTSIPPRERSYV